MSTLQSATARHPADPVVGNPHNANAATLALTRVEAWRLLRHPVVLAALAILLAILVVAVNDSDRFPVLYLEDSALLLQLTLVAAAALIATNLGVLRTHRHGVTTFTDVLTLPLWRRTLAHLLALLPLAVFAGLLAVARIGQLALRDGAVGRPNPLILAVAPALVLLFGAVGALLGRLVRSAVVAPLLLVLLVFGWLFRAPYNPDEDHSLGRLSPVELFERGFDVPPSRALDDRAGAHLLYLLGLAVVIAVVALLRAAAPRARTALAGIAALIVAVVGGVVQIQPRSADLVALRTAMTMEPSRYQNCVRHDPVSYCAFPEYLPWTGAWRQVVDGVRRRVPAAVAAAPLAVRQRTIMGNVDSNGMVNTGGSDEAWRADDRGAGTPEAVSIGVTWGQPRQAIQFAVHISHRLVTGHAVTDGVRDCGGVGLLTIWLAAQSTSAAEVGLPLVLDTQSSTRSKTFDSVDGGPNIEVGIREITLAQQLLQQPADRVAASVQQSWSQLTSPKTTLEEAAKLLGLPVPAKLAPMSAEDRAGYGPDFKECG